MKLFQWPFYRKTYPGINNPRFVDDILAANQAVLQGLTALLGALNTDFFILSGFAYTAGSPGSYTPGIIYLNGYFYYVNGMTEGQYIQGVQVDTMPQPFTDGNSRNIYTLNQGNPTSVSDPTYSPMFSGNMNQYRATNKYLATGLAAAQAILGNLGGAAFANIGTVAGTVAAGNDSRFGYTVAQINATFAMIANVLLLNNTTPYTPSQPYNPATKAYVDASSAGRILSGNYNIGNTTSGGAIYTVSLGTTLAISNYKVMATAVSTNPTNNAGGIDIIIKNKTTSSFDMWVYPQITVFTDISVDWILWTP